MIFFLSFSTFHQNRIAKKWKISKKFPIIKNSPFRFIVILDTTKTHKLNILRLNLRFSRQLYPHTHTHTHTYTYKYTQTKINTQTHIRLISKEYLSSSGIYKLIKVFLYITLSTTCDLLLRRSFFSFTTSSREKRKSFTSCHNLAFHFTSSHSSISTYML